MWLQVLQGDGNGPRLKAVAAVLARDTSAIVALPCVPPALRDEFTPLSALRPQSA